MTAMLLPSDIGNCVEMIVNFDNRLGSGAQPTKREVRDSPGGNEAQLTDVSGVAMCFT